MGLGGGAVFAGYTVERLLRTEYGGEQYLVAHPRLPRSDALWLFPPEWSADAGLSARFAREADLASMLDHPEILEVRDRGESDGRLWIAFEHVVGTDTASLLRDEYPDGLPPDQVVQIVTAVAEALDYAHDRGVVHGGVAPGHIVTANGGRAPRIVLTDFALSRFTEGVRCHRRQSPTAPRNCSPTNRTTGAPTSMRWRPPRTTYSLGHRHSRTPIQPW